MKLKLIIAVATAALLPLAGFAQPEPPPSTPLNPPVPPVPPDRHEHEHERDRGPKVPVTFLGVETSPVPGVVSEQLGLAKGFGLVVDYIVPDSPAAAAGIQQNDILKMLNDQILMEPSQLRKLLQSFSEGTNVTLTVLRKGQEQKITVKLVKKEMPRRHSMFRGHDGDWNFDFGDMDFGNLDMGELKGRIQGDLKERLQDLKEELKDQAGERRGVIHDAVMEARDAVKRAREEARQAGRGFRVFSNDDGTLKSTKIDIGKAQIVFSDDKGEMKLETVDGKKVLTAKDPQGKLLFSGPVETKEDLDKVPAEVRERYDKLHQKDLPGVNADQDESGGFDEEDEAPSMNQV